MPLIRKQPQPSAAADGPDIALGLAALSNPQPEERWRGARALAAFPEAAGPLGQALAGEAEASVRDAIFTSLARIGTDESLAALSPALRSDDAGLRTGAMDALKAMPLALPAALASLLKDADPDVRILACDLARELPSTPATALLAEVLESDPEPNVCGAAVDVIADIGSAVALAALLRCAERFADQPFLQFSIKVAVDRIGTQAT
jgi:HEAT repeat protein